jgi:hypothetical protein
VVVLGGRSARHHEDVAVKLRELITSYPSRLAKKASRARTSNLTVVRTVLKIDIAPL